MGVPVRLAYKPHTCESDYSCKPTARTVSEAPETKGLSTG